MQMMIENILPKDEEQRLRNMFMQMDEDGNGDLDKEELLAGLVQVYGDEEKAKAEVDRIFEIGDVDGSGTIDFSEFKLAFVKKELIL
jgi:calcium-dependent protein kinase